MDYDDIKDSNVPVDLMPAEQLNRLKEAFSILGELTRGKVLERIKELEDRKRMFDNLTVSRLDDHWKRIERLEGFKKQYDIDFTHNFEWKNNHHKRLDALEERARKHAISSSDHRRDVDVDSKILDMSDVERLTDKKVIDKQAWEYIKLIVSDIYETSSLNAVHPYRLVEAIKKIDTDWEPDGNKK